MIPASVYADAARLKKILFLTGSIDSALGMMNVDAFSARAPATKKCSACKAEIHFYRAMIGGKRYGDCKCERARTWIMDAGGVRFVNHNGTQHDAGCSCSYSELHGARS